MVSHDTRFMDLFHKPIAFRAMIAISCLVVADMVTAAVPSGPVQCDPTKVLGHEACMKCHGQEIAVWKQTPHFGTFKELHRKPEAKQIAERMGLRSIKRGDLCLNCHYTKQSIDGREKAIAGISCESCHGAAQDWIAIHNDYGGPTATKSSETPEHAKQRVDDAIAKGMQNPANLYLIARSCLNCHTVPNEQLVNVGGHRAGSADFELVAWSQGLIRHNFLRTDYASNAVSAPERLRLMYLVGKLTDLEYSLRATGQATQATTYGFSAAQRAFNVRRHLAEIHDLIDIPLLTEALDAAFGVKLKSKNREALELAADQVGTAAYQIAATVDGGSLSALDAFLPSEAQYKN